MLEDGRRRGSSTTIYNANSPDNRMALSKAAYTTRINIFCLEGIKAAESVREPGRCIMDFVVRPSQALLSLS